MTIQYASDLHLEFTRNKAFVKANPLVPKGNLLLLAGDIVPFDMMDKHRDFFNYISDNFVKTYWIPGNHEYYGYDLAKRQGSFMEDIKPNVHLVNNFAITHHDTRLVFSTLWSKISPGNQWQIERNVSDFRLIKYKGFNLTADRFNQLHEESLLFITNELTNKSANKTIVVTHHVPTLMNYPPQYIGSIINEAFATELYDLIETLGPDAWIYGHHHENVPDFAIGKTQMLTNQLGYLDYGEHLYFNLEQTINWKEQVI
jgi:predicted phosphohydrolase